MEMTHILLTGAGFSRNWGGYLASEAFEFLLSATEGDEELRSLLWRDHQADLGFEDTLAKLQGEYATEWSAQCEQDLRNLTSAVQYMFASMANGFSKAPFEWQPVNPEIGVINFLAKFDAIFTLNQDTLLEQRYIPYRHRSPLQSLDNLGTYRPGVIPTKDSSTYGRIAERIELCTVADSMTLVPNLQPYFKLHGSIDIKQSDREMMLVIGGNKTRSIEQQPLLKWYNEEFAKHLRSPDARLMIIGYSFGDHHINKMIFDGIEVGLKLFIIDPLGADVIGSNPSLPLNPSFLIRNSIIGASRRPLLSTLYGDDIVELNKIKGFFCTTG